MPYVPSEVEAPLKTGAPTTKRIKRVWGKWNEETIKEGWRDIANRNPAYKKSFFRSLIFGYDLRGLTNASGDKVAERLARLNHNDLEEILTHEKVVNATMTASQGYWAKGMNKVLLKILQGKGWGVRGALGFGKDVPRYTLAAALLTAAHEKRPELIHEEGERTAAPVNPVPPVVERREPAAEAPAEETPHPAETEVFGPLEVFRPPRPPAAGAGEGEQPRRPPRARRAPGVSWRAGVKAAAHSAADAASYFAFDEQTHLLRLLQPEQPQALLTAEAFAQHVREQLGHGVHAVLPREEEAQLQARLGNLHNFAKILNEYSSRGDLDKHRTAIEWFSKKLRTNYNPRLRTVGAQLTEANAPYRLFHKQKEAHLAIAREALAAVGGENRLRGPLLKKLDNVKKTLELEARRAPYLTAEEKRGKNEHASLLHEIKTFEAVDQRRILEALVPHLQADVDRAQTAHQEIERLNLIAARMRAFRRPGPARPT